MIDKLKTELRNKIKELKRNYSFEQKKIKSEKVIKQLEDLPEFKSAKVIMAYWSMKDEVFTHDLVQKYYGKKEIILPSVKGDTLVLKKFEGLSKLEEGEHFGINEPKGEVYDTPEKIDLIIVPGVAFDKEFNRLGRGKAYYDKLLKKTKAVKVGICFDFQFVEKVPSDQFDIKMDKVIFEQKR